MKRMVMLFLVVTSAWAKDHDVSEYPLKAHVVSSGEYRSSGGFTTYNPNAKASCPRCQPQYSTSGTSNSVTENTELLLDGLIYATEPTGRCGRLSVGTNYPAKHENIGKRRESIKLLVGNRECKYEVEGSREAVIPDR